MGKVKQTRRQLSKFFNWRCSVTLTDGRVLVGTLMAVDRHVNLVLCNTEEYRKYKVKGKPEGKELKRMLGFIVVRGTQILYVQPEECGREELVETDKSKKIKAAPKETPKAGTPSAGMAGMLPGMPAGLAGLPGMPQGMRMLGMPQMQMPTGLPGLGMNPALMQTLAGMRPPAMQGMPMGMPGMTGGLNPALFAAMGGKATMPGGFGGLNTAMLMAAAGKAPGMPPGMTFPGMMGGGMGGGMGGMRPPM